MLSTLRGCHTVSAIISHWHDSPVTRVNVGMIYPWVETKQWTLLWKPIHTNITHHYTRLPEHNELKMYTHIHTSSVCLFPSPSSPHKQINDKQCQMKQWPANISPKLEPTYPSGMNIVNLNTPSLNGPECTKMTPCHSAGVIVKHAWWVIHTAYQTVTLKMVTHTLLWLNLNTTVYCIKTKVLKIQLYVINLTILRAGLAQ